MNKSSMIAAGALVLAGGFGLPGHAADSYGTWVSGALSLEFQHDAIYDTSDGSAGGDSFATVELGVAVHLTHRLSLDIGLTVEPVLGLGPAEDRVFGDHGLYADTLKLRYEGDDWFVHGGKFTAPFGLVQASLPGLYGDVFAADYELVERLGVGGGVEIELPEVATLAVAAAVFKRDSTPLSDSFGTGRGRLRPSDGGPGNTDLPESFSLVVDAGDFDASPGLGLRGSVLHQAPGAGDALGQWAFGLGGSWEIDLGDDWAVTPLVEYVHSVDAVGIDGAVAAPGATQHYLTAGVALGWGAWNAALAGGRRWDSRRGQTETVDSFVQVSAGYRFDNDIGIDVGWLHLDQAGVTSRAVGVLVSYALPF